MAGGEWGCTIGRRLGRRTPYNVHESNLWVLLAPVGRQIELESLAGQVLAVDASIWLTQFVKAMRDDEGNMIRNAHLMGTLHRVAKLLFYGVRPVFVFDGQTPEIKKRTTARRRKRQEQQSANLKHTAQRILLNRLRQQQQELRKTGAAQPSAVAPGVILPVSGETQKAAEEEEESEEKQQETDEKEGDQLTLEDIELDTSRLNKIDLHAVFSLPPHLQKDMIQKILRDRRQEVRDQFIPLAGNPEAYSHTQISAFLETSALNRRIEAAKSQKKDEEMQQQGDTGLGPGQRIDSNSNRFYIYQKDEEHKQSEDREEDVVAEIEQTDAAERDTVAGSEVLGKGHSAFKAIDKRPLSEFPGGKAGQVPDASAKAVTDAWVARHQVRVKQEPMLAIEKLRRSKVEPEEIPTTVPADDPKLIPVSDVSVSVKLDDMDPEDMARLKKLFPGTAVNPVEAKPLEADEDEDVDWEEVPATSNTSAPSEPKGDIDDAEEKQLALLSSSVVNNVFSEKDEDEEMEWEDVPAEAGSDKPSSSQAVLDQDAAVQDQNIASAITEALQEENIEEQAVDEDGTDELFLTLKNEMEDAKAHGDLDLLKDEALKSAMATASNLTQWAAGAVRRALEAHSLQHGHHRSPVAATEVRTTSQFTSEKGSAEAPVEVSDDENDFQSPSPATKTPEVVEIDEGNESRPNDTEEDDSNRRLQAALAASIAEEKEGAGDQRVRYLQYTQPSESASTAADKVQQEMDAAALQQEQIELRKLRSRQLRDTEGITDEMVAEVMALLRLFGVPFLVSPMEAEAQCAALEQLGLVDGVITDDSDIFPFGGQRVYKNIFHHQKFVEAFSAQDIARELGFSREQIIAIALLLGSDYTDGVRGIGIVNATEIAAAYPGLDGLREFKEWVGSFDVSEEAQRLASAGSKKKKSKTSKGKHNGSDDEGEESEDETVRERFQRSHASVRRKWELGDEFPSKQVVQAYMSPQVDRSEARFSWSAPDLAALRNYCANAFGWDQLKSDGVLRPLEEKAKEAAANSGRHIQTRLDRFFTSYDDQVHYAKIKSKRLRSAVNQGTGTKKKAGKKQRK